MRPPRQSPSRRPAGDPADAPAARTYPEGWQIGTPDAVFEFAEPMSVPATGVMPYQTVIVETHLPEDHATAMGFLPHMHVRGKACRYELIRGDGSRTKLLDIPRYDFNWQLLYRRHEPLPPQAGDTLVFTAWYDNSAGNPANPDPTKTVRWGPQTFDEMHLGYVEYFVPGVAPGDPQPSLRRGSGGLRDRARP